MHITADELVLISLEYYGKEDSVDDEGSEEGALGWLSDTRHVRRQGSLHLLLVHQIFTSMKPRLEDWESLGPLPLVGAEGGQ